MTDAKTLLLNLLAVIPDGEKAVAFFAEDGVLELPFLHAIGIPRPVSNIKRFPNPKRRVPVRCWCSLGSRQSISAISLSHGDYTRFIPTCLP